MALTANHDGISNNQSLELQAGGFFTMPAKYASWKELCDLHLEILFEFGGSTLQSKHKQRVSPAKMIVTARAG